MPAPITSARSFIFSNSDFYDFRERCDLAGIHVPIIAGIMPITSKENLTRMAELALGTRVPAKLLRAVGRCEDDPQAVAKVGIHWATEQCRDLLDNQVRGIHFYTLNRSDATRQIYENLGVKDLGRASSGAASRVAPILDHDDLVAVRVELTLSMNVRIKSRPRPPTRVRSSDWTARSSCDASKPGPSSLTLKRAASRSS